MSSPVHYPKISRCSQELECKRAITLQWSSPQTDEDIGTVGVVDKPNLEISEGAGGRKRVKNGLD